MARDQNNILENLHGVMQQVQQNNHNFLQQIEVAQQNHREYQQRRQYLNQLQQQEDITKFRELLQMLQDYADMNQGHYESMQHHIYLLQPQPGELTVRFFDLTCSV
jgi:lipopolysaccharide biosynthesis regulator YciM